MRKLTVSILAFLVIGLGAIGVNAQTVYKLAYNAPVPVIGPIADKLTETVTSKMEGKYQIKSFGNGQLGSNTQNFAQIKTGQIDMLLIGTNLLNIAAGGKDFEVLSVPYMFRDQDHFTKYISSPLFKSMIGRAEKDGGLVCVGFLGSRVPRQLSSNRRIARFEDLKGLKVRVPENRAAIETWKAWGAVPVSVPGSELYTALKQGVVNGQDNGVDSIAAAKLYEVQKYVVPIDYIRWGLVLLMNADQWKKLGPIQQKALEDAVAETERYGTKLSNDTLAASTEICKKNGMEILAPDLSPFKMAAAAVTSKLDGELWEKGLYEKIQAIK
jgi:TRAP-type transport system periplasmic protein